MESRKIKIGQHYGYSRSRTNRPMRVEVLDRVQISPARYYREAQMGWSVRLLTDDGQPRDPERTINVESRWLTRPWEEQAIVNNEADRQQQEKEREERRRRALGSAVAERLGLADDEWGDAHSWGATTIDVYAEKVAKRLGIELIEVEDSGFGRNRRVWMVKP